MSIRLTLNKHHDSPPFNRRSISRRSISRRSISRRSISRRSISARQSFTCSQAFTSILASACKAFHASDWASFFSMLLHARRTPILTLLSTKKVALTLRKTNKQTNKQATNTPPVATFTAQAVSRPYQASHSSRRRQRCGPLTYLYESAH